MRHYPALLCLWAMGVSAVLAEREQLLARFLVEPTWMPIFGKRIPRPAVRCLDPHRIPVGGDPAPTGKRWIYPQSRHLRAVRREAVRQLEPDDDAYQAACDRFEYLASMAAMDGADQPGQLPWAGDFIFRVKDFDTEQPLGTLITEELISGWPFLDGGAFGGDLDRATAANAALLAWIAQYGQTF